MPQSVTLKAGYTQKDVFLAALQVQLEEYADSKYGRSLESPRVEECEDGSLILHRASHNAKLVNRFKEIFEQAPVDPEWNEVRAKYPLTLNANGDWVGDLSTFTKYDIANFLSLLITQFQKEIMSSPSVQMNSNDLILSAVNIFAHVIVPSGGKTADENSQAIWGFCTVPSTKFCDMQFMAPAPENSLDSCCEAMLRLISLTLTQPIGNEKAYGGMIGKESPAERMKVFSNESSSGDAVEIRPGHYIIPEESFNIPRGRNEDEQILQNFFTFNLGFLNQIDAKKCSPEIYKATVQRLWNAYIADKRCPQWIKEKEVTLKDEIFQEGAQEKHVILYPLIKIFSGMPDRIQYCNRNDMTSLEFELKSLAGNTLLTLVKNTKIIFPDKEKSAEALSFVKNQLQKLFTQYAKEKTLNAGFCSEIFIEINKFIASFENAGAFFESSIIDHENFSQKNFLLAALDKLEMRSLSMTWVEKKRVKADITALKGVIPNECRAKI